MPNNKPFTFEISLSVLDHLGRNLYRSFATVLGEAISNSWDADAKNVWIYIDKEKSCFFIKDDGVGMTADDFQNKFLKIGYSKRKAGKKSSAKGRPYIGRKGIGKLALLSCADKISVISKVNGGSYIGGVIDNSGLNKAITEDLTPQQYPLGNLNQSAFKKYVKDHDHGTIIYFEGIKDGIRNSLGFLRKIIALYFRFSLLDGSFNIFIDGQKITNDDLNDLAQKTEFAWNINKLDDPYVKEKLTSLKEPSKAVKMDGEVRGFIASVGKPRDLTITGTDERVSVDLFVNGRLRERDILKHIPTARIAENYLYGQIHFDKLDDEEDRFTSSREGVVADDPKYRSFLEELRKKILDIVTDWDKWRIKHRKDGDSENETVSKKKRKSLELYNAVSEEYDLPKDSKNRKDVDEWVDELSDDAAFNFESYAECFISENLVRKYIQKKKIPLSKEANIEAARWKKAETENKKKGNISIDIRETDNDLGYLSMSDLAYLVDKKDPIKEACLPRDANEYKPIRDAIAHTALLTDASKKKLTTVYANIQGRIKTLLSGK
jgi:hypothetical protein